MDINESRQERVGRSILVLLAGLALTAAGLWAGRQLHIVWNIWPCTDGVVVRAAVEEIVVTPYAKGGLPVHHFIPKVEFRYTVDGKFYSTEAPSVYTADTYQAAAASVARLYAPGTHHPLRYNPRHPGEIEFGTIAFSSLAFAFLLLVAGVELAVAGSRMLIVEFAPRAQMAPAKEGAIPAAVLPFAQRAPAGPSTATLHCPACGALVPVTEDICPQCFKSLRAA